MNKWVAERFSENEWRDEDVARTSYNYVSSSFDGARTMLVGMIMLEAFDFKHEGYDWCTERYERLEGIADEFSQDRDLHEVRSNGLVFRIREYNS